MLHMATLSRNPINSESCRQGWWSYCWFLLLLFSETKIWWAQGRGTKWSLFHMAWERSSWRTVRETHSTEALWGAQGGAGEPWISPVWSRAEEERQRSACFPCPREKRRCEMLCMICHSITLVSQKNHRMAEVGRDLQRLPEMMLKTPLN